MGTKQALSLAIYELGVEHTRLLQQQGKTPRADELAEVIDRLEQLREALY